MATHMLHNFWGSGEHGIDYSRGLVIVLTLSFMFLIAFASMIYKVQNLTCAEPAHENCDKILSCTQACSSGF